jgi:predicted signal transduction protein with EAL and GGDEF domain
MSRLAENAAAESGADTLLFDRTGTIIAAAPNPEDWIGRTIADEPELAAAFASSTGVLETALFDGQQRIVAHARLRPDAGEVLAVAIPKEAIVAPFERRTRAAMTKLGFTVLASLLLIWLGTERLIMRPVAAFAERARRIGDGDLPAPASRSELLPELRPLAETLDSMAAKLAAREGDLREANALLAGLAATDPLTGLGNRRDFAARSAEEWARTIRERRWIAALAIDIDHFKPFNDR